MITPAPFTKSERSDDSDLPGTRPEAPRPFPERDRFERGVRLPGIEPTRAPREKDKNPLPSLPKDKDDELDF